MSFTSAEQRAMMDFLARSGGVTAQQVAAPSYVPKTGPVAAPAITPLPAALPYTAPPVNLAPLAAPPPPPSPIMGALMQGAAQQRQFQQQLSAPLYETPAWQGHRRGTGGLDNEQVGFQWSPEATGNSLERYVDPDAVAQMAQGGNRRDDLSRYLPGTGQTPTNTGMSFGQAGIPIATIGAAPPNSQSFDNIQRMTPTGPDATGTPSATVSPSTQTAQPGQYITDQDRANLMQIQALGGDDPANTNNPTTFYDQELARIRGSAELQQGNDQAIQQYPGQIEANNQEIARIDAEIARLSEEEAASGVYPSYNAPTNTTIWTDANGNTIRTAEGDQTQSPTAPGVNNDEQINALVYERDQLVAQNHTMEQRLLIAQGDTYQGRPNPGFDLSGDNLGFNSQNAATALNVIDAGRETVVTEYGDAAAQWLQTGDANATVQIINALSGPDRDSDPEFVNDVTITPGMLTGEEPLPPEIAQGPQNEDEARNSEYAGAWMIGWLNEHPDRRQEALEVYYSGYDANGDGSIDYVGGRALWEWYIGQQSWVTSLVSQVFFDPLNLTIIAGGVSTSLGVMADGAKIAGNAAAASKLTKAAMVAEWLSRIDDPIWWAYSGPKAVVKGTGSRIGRAAGWINDATGSRLSSTGEKMSRADAAAANARAQAGDPTAYDAFLQTPADQVPVHNPVTISGQQYQQVGNSGGTFIRHNADGTFTVMTRSENGTMTAGSTYATFDEARVEAVSDERMVVGAMAANGQQSMAQAFDSSVPIVYRDNEAIVGPNGEYRVVRNADGTFSVQVWNGSTYLTTPGNFTDGQTAVQAAQQDYLNSSGSMTTGGGVQVSRPRAGKQWTGAVNFGSQPPGPGGVGGSGAAPGPTGPAGPGGPGTGPGAGPGTAPGGAAPGATTAPVRPGQPIVTPGGATLQPSATGTVNGTWTVQYGDGSSTIVTGNGDGTFSVYAGPGRAVRMTQAQLNQYVDANLRTRGGASSPQTSPPKSGQQGMFGGPTVTRTSAGVPPQGTGAASSVAPGPPAPVSGQVYTTPGGVVLTPDPNEPRRWTGTGPNGEKIILENHAGPGYAPSYFMMIGDKSIIPVGEGSRVGETVDNFTSGPAVSRTPDGGAPLDPSLNVRPADVTPNQPVTRGTTSYEYGGTVMMDGQPVATWQVTTADGYIYNVGTTSQSDGALRIEYTGQQVQPDGSVATVDQPQMVNVGGVTTLDSTAPLIEGHASTLGPAPGAPLGGDSAPPSGAGAVPTEGATDVGAGAAPSTAPSGTGIFPPQAATDDTVAPPTGEGSLGGSQTPGEVAGDLGDTAAANVNVGAAPEAEDIRPKVPRIDRPSEAADAARLTRQGDIAPASVEGGIADGTRIMDDTVPAGAAPSPASVAPPPASAAPSPAGAAPAGAAPSPGSAAPAPRTGMYGGQITARNGATVIDYAPSEIWIDSAVKQVSSRIGDDATAKQIVRDFISSNPRIRESAGEFADALRAGDEVDQALASMELQATLAEEWAHTGMAVNYGPVATDYMSPGAAGMSPASATFPTEWPKTGRAIERMATGRGTPNDFGNLARSGFLPGRESDLANMIRSGTLDRFVASTGGRPFILPDGITRLYSDELAAMSPAQRAQLADQVMARMGDPVLSARPGSTQDRINDLRDRFNAITNGAPQRGPVSGTADAPRPQASRPTAPDADTKRVKQDAQAMTPAQEKVKPGTPSPITLTHDWGETTGYIDQFGNSVRKTLKETEEIYNHPGVYDSLDPAKRYDVVRVSVNKRSSFYTLADEDGILRGYGKTDKQLLKRVAEARPDVPFLRIFNGDRLVVSSRQIKDPSTLYTRMVHSGTDGNKAAVIRVVGDSDGRFHIVTETADGKRLAVFNDYDDLHAARTDIDRAIQRGGGLDWPLYGPDGGPLFKGKGLGGANANIPLDLQKVKTFVSSVRPAKRPAVPNPKNDGTFAGRLFDEGAITEDVYKTLKSTYKKADGTEVVVQEEIFQRMMKYGNLDRAFHEVLDEWSASFAPVRKVGKDGKPVPKALGAKVFEEGNRGAREMALYGIHRTLPALFGEMISNTYNSLLTGNGFSNLKQLFTMRETGQIIKAMRAGDDVDILNDTLDIFKDLKHTGSRIRAEEVVAASKFDLPTEGDMAISRLLQRIGSPRWAANIVTEPLASRLNRGGRQLNDIAHRLGVLRTQYDGHLRKARANMVDVVRNEAMRLGEDPDAWATLLRNLDTRINADELRAAFGGNKTILRGWQEQLRLMDEGMENALRKYTFIGGRTKIDDALSKVIFFHYWNSRSIALHAEIAAKNPLLISLYAGAYEYASEQAEELNLPTYLRTWLRFAGSELGWMGFFNPLGLVVPLFMLTEMNLIGGSDNDFGPDRFSWNWFLQNFPMSPWLIMGTAAVGQLDYMMDPTYSTGTRNMIRTFINWARAEGLGPLDKHLSPSGDPADDLIDNAMNWLSKTVGVNVFGGKEVEQTSSTATDYRLLNLMMDQKMDELFGPGWREDPALVQYANEGKAAFESGTGHNAASESVYMQWARDKGKQAIVRSFMPGWASYQYGPLLEQRAQVDEIFAKLKRGEEITDEEQITLDAYTDNGLTADARNLNSQLDAYYDIGTQFQRELHQVRNELLYGEAPEGSWVVIDDNEYYSAEEWNAMSTEDRRLAVHKWVAAQGGTDQLNAYYAARDEWRAAHPEAGDYLDWREAFRADPVTIHNEMMRISPGYANYINGLKDPTDQDRWFTVEAYYASLGEEYGLNDNPDDPLDPSQANPMQAITGYQSPPPEAPYQPKEKEGDEERETYGSGEWSSEREWRENAPGEYVEAMQQQYEEEVAAVQPIVDDVLEQGGWSWMGDMTYAEIEAESQKKGTSRQYDEALKAIKNAFYFNDITTPTVDMEVRDYNRWRDQRLAADPNADVSPQAYEEAKINSQNAYGVGPQNDPEEQAYQARRDQERQNTAAANWWAYNPNAVPGQGFYPKEQRNPLDRYIPVAERGPYANPYGR